MNGSPELADDAFLAAFEDALIDSHSFHHRDHLRTAWLYVQRMDLSDAIERADAGLRRLARHAGVAHKYHRTVTQAWMNIVAFHISESPSLAFDTFLERHPQLEDKRLLGRHYRSQTLADAEARSRWVEPDLVPFPFSVT